MTLQLVTICSLWIFVCNLITLALDASCCDIQKLRYVQFFQQESIPLGSMEDESEVKMTNWGEPAKNLWKAKMRIPRGLRMKPERVMLLIYLSLFQTTVRTHHSCWDTGPIVHGWVISRDIYLHNSEGTMYLSVFLVGDYCMHVKAFLFKMFFKAHTSKFRLFFSTRVFLICSSCSIVLTAPVVLILQSLNF